MLYLRCHVAVNSVSNFYVMTRFIRFAIFFVCPFLFEFVNLYIKIMSSCEQFMYMSFFAPQKRNDMSAKHSRTMWADRKARRKLLSAPLEVF